MPERFLKWPNFMFRKAETVETWDITWSSFTLTTLRQSLIRHIPFQKKHVFACFFLFLITLFRFGSLQFVLHNIFVACVDFTLGSQTHGLLQKTFANPPWYIRFARPNETNLRLTVKNMSSWIIVFNKDSISYPYLYLINSAHQMHSLIESSKSPQLFPTTPN